jgi:hypothetical protein
VVVASAAGRVCAIVVAAIVDIKKCHYPQCTGKAICNLKNAILSFFQLWFDLGRKSQNPIIPNTSYNNSGTLLFVVLRQIVVKSDS